jgi:hypothetical protein
MQVGAKMLFAWRALMLAVVSAGGVFLLDGWLQQQVVSSYGLVLLLSCYAICC